MGNSEWTEQQDVQFLNTKRLFGCLTEDNILAFRDQINSHPQRQFYMRFRDEPVVANIQNRTIEAVGQRDRRYLDALTNTACRGDGKNAPQRVAEMRRRAVKCGVVVYDMPWSWKDGKQRMSNKHTRIATPSLLIPPYNSSVQMQWSNTTSFDTFSLLYQAREQIRKERGGDGTATLGAFIYKNSPFETGLSDICDPNDTTVKRWVRGILNGTMPMSLPQWAIDRAIEIASGSMDL